MWPQCLTESLTQHKCSVIKKDHLGARHTHGQHPLCCSVSAQVFLRSRFSKPCGSFRASTQGGRDAALILFPQVHSQKGSCLLLHHWENSSLKSDGFAPDRSDSLGS